MSTFYLSAGIQFASILFLGLPLAVALTARDRSSPSLGWFLLAPALGAIVYLSLGTILHSFGLQSGWVFWGLTGLSAACLCLMLSRAKRPRPGLMLGGIAICLVAAALALAANAADLLFAGLDYFPLTNDDTFSYLGHIDQIRSVGWIEPRMSYPAGYVPLIDHAVFTRTPGVILVADFADILGLETHSSFFLMQRLALPMIALGATGLVMLVTSSLTAALLCFASLVFGNVLLHQILQQFNSSTMGTVIAPVIIAVALWTFRSERSERETVAGCALAGWACGTMAITSMEAHPFYLMAFGVVAIVPMVSERKWVKVLKGAGAFTALYLASSFPFVMKIWPALISQFVNAGNGHPGHPGDWIAATGFLMQASGVTFTTADKLSVYSIVPRIAAISVLASVAIAIVVLTWTAMTAARRSAVLRSDLVALICVALLLSFLQTVLYARGSGYALLKVTDYFAFVGAIVVSVAAFQLGLTSRRTVGGLLVALVGGYCAVAFVEKQQILALYGKRTALMPLSTSYRLGAASADAAVYPDLSVEPLNLFLYENRYGATRILFSASESNRYLPVGGAGLTEPRQIARMSRVGALGTVVADITYPADASAPVLKVAPAIGQTHIVQPDPHWSPPNGADVNSLWRWLSVSGRFVIYGPLAENQRTLQVNLAAGPDMHPDNRIELYVSGERLLTISPGELPRRVLVSLPALSKPENEGEIRVVGPTGGIHQLSVAKLLSVSR